MVKVAKAILFLTPLLLCGCGGSKEGSFKSLVAEKEARLKQLLDKKTEDGRTDCRDIRSHVEGDSGFLEFNHFHEYDRSRLGKGMLRFNVGWKVRYEFKGGKWEYDLSEREIWDLNAQPQGWAPAEDSRNETDIAILGVLK